MKKNGIIFLFAAMGLLAGCLKEQPAAEINQGSTLEVSIAPETIAANLEDYIEMITNSGIADYAHKGLLLEISFERFLLCLILLCLLYFR